MVDIMLFKYHIALVYSNGSAHWIDIFDKGRKEKHYAHFMAFN